MNIPNPPSQTEHSQLRTILLLFIILRMSILLLYTPQGPLNVYSDYFFYFKSAQFLDQGYYPFINMWYEYPPILAYLPHGSYALTRIVMPPGEIGSFTYIIFALVLGMILLPFEIGTLVLLHRITDHVWGTSRANWAGWVYASLGLPLYYWSYSHQTVVTFFTLLTLYWFIREMYYGSALAMGLGIASKLTPVILFAPFVKFLWPQRGKIVRYAALVGLTVVVIYAPFVVLGGWKWIEASFAALGKVGSWSTVWALIDGNWRAAYYGPAETRIDLARADEVFGNPSVIPGWLLLGAFALLYSWFYFRRIEYTLKNVIWFSTLTTIIFYLWSKGWSPQWTVTLIPFFLLSFPDRKGLFTVLSLTALAMLEWPLAAAFEARTLMAITILARTGLFVWIGWELGRRVYSTSMLKYYRISKGD